MASSHHTIVSRDIVIATNGLKNITVLREIKSPKKKLVFGRLIIVY